MLNSQQPKPVPIKEPLPTLSKLPPKVTISFSSSVSLTHSAAATIHAKMRAGASSYHRYEHTHRQPHFLDSCFLCRKTLSQKSDIYMYRGNTPFCSQECRQEQIATDEANEKRLKLSSSKRSSNTVRQTTESEKEFDSNKSAQSNTVAVS